MRLLRGTCLAERSGTCVVTVAVATTLVTIIKPEITPVEGSILQVRRLKPRGKNDLPNVSRVFYKCNQVLYQSFSKSGPQISPSPGSLLKRQVLLNQDSGSRAQPSAPS